MDYTDIYLRQRRKEESTPLHLTSSMETDTVGGQRMEHVLKGAFSVQELVDRLETLSTRIDTFDEKMVNLTKLVKLAQGLQEEKEVDLRRQQQELRSRLKRQEQMTMRFQEELCTLRDSIPTFIRDALNTFRQDYENDTAKMKNQGELQLAQARGEIEETLNVLRRDMEQRVVALQRETFATFSNQIDGPNGFRERLGTIEKSVKSLEEANESPCIRSLEVGLKQLSESLNLLRQQTDTTTNSMAAIELEREKAQDAIIEELESTRQWATRNLQRVKQHMEKVTMDISSLQKEQIDVSTRLNRVSCQADVEYKKLQTLLVQKAREADTLCTIVEKEFSKVEDVTERHQGLRKETSALKDMAF